MGNIIQFPVGDEAEIEARERSRVIRWGKPGCVSWRNGNRCTRALGHRGDHVAAVNGRVVARWVAGTHEAIEFG